MPEKQAELRQSIRSECPDCLGYGVVDAGPAYAADGHRHRYVRCERCDGLGMVDEDQDRTAA